MTFKIKIKKTFKIKIKFPFSQNSYITCLFSEIEFIKYSLYWI